MLTVAKFDRYDMVNTPGSDKPAFTMWFSGCSQKCPGCYNQKLWDVHSGIEHDVKSVIMTICRECENLDINDVVLLGGEPMEQNADDLLTLVQKLKGYGYKIWMYTSWEFDNITASIKSCLYTIKCGKYDESLKYDGIPSSTNQKFYRLENDQWNEITF